MKGNLCQEVPIMHGEIFDQQRKLKKILRANRRDRILLLRQFKKRLMQQREELANLQILIESEIRSNPDISLSKALRIVEEFSCRHGFASWQKRRIFGIIGRYKRKYEIMMALRKKYSDDRELFLATFGMSPKGRVEVVLSPFTIYFRTHDIVDYASVYSFKGPLYKTVDIKEKEIETAEQSGGVCTYDAPVPDLRGLITAEKAKGKKFSSARPQEVFAHEERHAMNSFLIRREGGIVSRDSGYLYKNVESWNVLWLNRFLQNLKRRYEIRAKDEVLAFLAGGSDYDSIQRSLTEAEEEGGIYDYFSYHRNWVAKQKEDCEKTIEKFSEFSKKASKKKERLGIEKIINERKEFSENLNKFSELLDEVLKEYLKNLGSALLALSDLQKMGYGKEKIIAILTTEPLAKWPKLIRRLKEFRKEKLKKMWADKDVRGLFRYFLEWLTS